MSELIRPADEMRATLFKGMGIAVGEIQDPSKPPAQEPEPAKPAQPKGNDLGFIDLATSSRIADDMARFKEEEEKNNPPPEKKEEPTKPEDKKADAPPPAEGKKDEAPKEEVAVETKPPVSKVIEDTVQAALSKLAANRPKEEPKADPEKPQDKTSDIPQGLNDAQEEEYRLALYAAKSNPAKHKDLPAKLLEFYKGVESYVKTEAAKSEERTFDDGDVEFQRFIKKTRPPIDPVERRRLERSMIKEEALAESKAAVAAELAEVKKRQADLEAKPLLEKYVKEFDDHITQVFESDPEVGTVAKTARSEGWDKALEADPFAGPVLRDAKQAAITLASEYLHIKAGVKPYDPNNQDHVFLARFIKGYGDYISSGQGKIRDGKTFMPVHEYYAVLAKDPGAAGKYWTLDDREILGGLARNTHLEAVKHIKSEEERLSKAGFARQKKASAASKPAEDKPAHPKEEKKPADPDPSSSPKATPSASPGMAKTGGVSSRRALSDADYKALAIPIPT